MSNYSGPVNPNAANSQPVPPGQPRVATRVAPASWLAPAIVSTLCCFAPTGVVALYFAAQVGAYWNAGNQVAAIAAAKRARRWVIISMLFWVVAMVFLVATGRMGALFESGIVTGG